MADFTIIYRTMDEELKIYSYSTENVYYKTLLWSAHGTFLSNEEPNDKLKAFIEMIPEIEGIELVYDGKN